MGLGFWAEGLGFRVRVRETGRVRVRLGLG